METLLLKDFPADLKGRLQESAQKNRRSMAQEAIYRLERSLELIDPVVLPRRRIKLSKPLTTAETLKAIRQGRR